MTRILLVGGGLTSAVTGALLRREIPNAELVIWDKARGAGGRMATSRSPHDGGCTADLGAQYITATPHYQASHKAFYDELVSGGVLTPLTAGVAGMRAPEGARHYVTPRGVSSLVKYFINQADVDTKFGQHVSGVYSEGGRWRVETEGGEAGQFDAVVLTMPVPQVMGLAGSVKELIDENEDLRNKLLSVDYSSRYALGLFYDKQQPVSLQDGLSAQYVADDPVIRFIAIDNLKRGSEDSAPSVVVHTSVPFGKEHVEETPDQVKPLLLQRVSQVFPDLPQPSHVKCQKWRYSQVVSAYPGKPGCVAVGAGLVVGGDGFTHSNMDGCIASAQALAAAVAQ